MGLGGSLLSGLFGSGSSDQTTRSTVDYEGMVRSAEKAGFNPLTAIRNGGSAGFTSTTTPGNPLGGALSRVGDWLTGFNPFEDAERSQRARLLDAQIANLNAETGNLLHTVPSRHGPVASGAGVRNAPASLALRDPLVRPPPATALSAVSGAPIAAPTNGSLVSTARNSASAVLAQLPPLEMAKSQRTSWLERVSGGYLMRDPNRPAVEDFETDYGDSELGSTVAGGLALSTDLMYNVGRYDDLLARKIGRPEDLFKMGRHGKPYRPKRPRGRFEPYARGSLYDSPFGMPVSGPSF
ncbi:hypothetical protein NKH09_17535 [Mesorhizobium sp. M1339]|uniref:hypothetical protein n=1 Tax=Mesorhizobium sp. M1339 TaxID=2957086 RepID=UPI00333A2247